MPDIGDYEFNGRFVRADSINATLHSTFDTRRGPCAVLFVQVNPRRDWADVRFLEKEAAKLDIPVFDAERSQVLAHAAVMTCRTIFVPWGDGVTKACSNDWSQADSAASQARHVY